MFLKQFIAYPRCPENLQKLHQIAYNLWFTWNYEAINLFYRIDPELYRNSRYNPVKFLHGIPEDKLNALSRDEGFLFELEKVWSKFQDYLNYKTTFKCPLPCSIAYFSMEYGLHECLPIYAGGLGILAGDLLKGASDMDIPITGVGLLYKHGYFTQRIDSGGNQQELETVPFDKGMAPIKELREPDSNNPVVITLNILKQPVRAKAWEVNIGKSRLILLDTDIEENPPENRGITDDLYPADREKRMRQELLLGIGGVEVLSAAGIEPVIYHLNEGHSAFLVIARLKKLMAEKTFSFSEARAIIKASTVFTTHTPVIAGNENFSSDMVKKYLGPELEPAGLSYEDIERFGFINNVTDTFWLPAFAMNFAGLINGVSKRHCEVSRKMWAPLFPGLPPAEIPITYITNGVHTSWISEPFTDIFNRYLGPNYIHSSRDDEIWNRIFEIPDEELWEAHKKNKKDMVSFLRKQMADPFFTRKYPSGKGTRQATRPSPDYLTVVFARRFATYKRPTLILKDRERIKNILTNEKKPVQLIFAGKAHPADKTGKEMIKEVLAFAKEEGIEDRILFFENYDIHIARHLAWGSDVWLNTPIEGMEASGTSGMKAAMNGVLNLSVIDGWWVEGFNGKNGWGISAGELHANPELREAAEANQIYTFLEEEITESFFNRSEAGLPMDWLRMMKESLFYVCRNFNINRALDNYMNDFYIPCVKKSHLILKDNRKRLSQGMEAEKELIKHWEKVVLREFNTTIDRKERVLEGEIIEADCSVHIGDAPPELFKAELFYMFNSAKFKVIPLELAEVADGVAKYKGSFKIESHGAQDINVRIKPADEIVETLHPELIKWKD